MTSDVQISDTLAATPTSSEKRINIKASEGFGGWLASQGLCLVISSYKTDRLISLGTDAQGRLVGDSIGLPRCMGAGLGKAGLWVSSEHQLWHFDNILEQGQKFQGHDAVYLPGQTTFTGAIDMHDIAETRDGKPVFVVPRFNCLATIAKGYSFQVVWTPPFIDQIVAEDRCHLNGLAMREGRPAYVTCVATTNVSGAWRDHRRDGGVIIDVETSEVIASGLSMPHSPRLHGGYLWFLDSGSGKFRRMSIENGTSEEVTTLNGFARGLAFHKKWAIVGVSRPRLDRGFKGLEIADRLEKTGEEPICAIVCINTQTGDIEHQVEIGPDVEEIYDVVVLPDARNPLLIDPQSDNAKFFIRPKL